MSHVLSQGLCRISGWESPLVDSGHAETASTRTTIVLAPRNGPGRASGNFFLGGGKAKTENERIVTFLPGSARSRRILGILDAKEGWGFSNRVNFYFACFFFALLPFSFAKRSIFFAEEINVGVCVCACLSGFYPSGRVLPAQDKTQIRRSGVYLIGMVPINLTMCCWF